MLLLRLVEKSFQNWVHSLCFLKVGRTSDLEVVLANAFCDNLGTLSAKELSSYHHHFAQF